MHYYDICVSLHPQRMRNLTYFMCTQAYFQKFAVGMRTFVKKAGMHMHNYAFAFIFILIGSLHLNTQICACLLLLQFSRLVEFFIHKLPIQSPN